MHALAQLLTESIDLPIVGPHSLAHDARRHADHVSVAHLPALDDGHDRHARAELTLQWLDAEDAGIRPFECAEHCGRSFANRPGRDPLDQDGIDGCVALGERLLEARRHLTTGLVSNEGDALAGLDRQAGGYRIARPLEQIGRSRSEGHPINCNSRKEGLRTSTSGVGGRASKRPSSGFLSPPEA
jgi:hypothetical protein